METHLGLGRHDAGLHGRVRGLRYRSTEGILRQAVRPGKVLTDHVDGTAAVEVVGKSQVHPIAGSERFAADRRRLGKGIERTHRVGRVRTGTVGYLTEMVGVGKTRAERQVGSVEKELGLDISAFQLADRVAPAYTGQAVSKCVVQLGLEKREAQELAVVHLQSLSRGGLGSNPVQARLLLQDGERAGRILQQQPASLDEVAVDIRRNLEVDRRVQALRTRVLAVHSDQEILTIPGHLQPVGHTRYQAVLVSVPRLE